LLAVKRLLTGASFSREGHQPLEPAQRVIVAHNGTQELLIPADGRSVGQAGQGHGKFMPFPSPPAVSLAPDNCFGNLQRLVTDASSSTWLLQFQGREMKGRRKIEEIRVVAEHMLAPHDITVVEILNAGKASFPGLCRVQLDAGDSERRSSPKRFDSVGVGLLPAWVPVHGLRRSLTWLQQLRLILLRLWHIASSVTTCTTLSRSPICTGARAPWRCSCAQPLVRRQGHIVPDPIS